MNGFDLENTMNLYNDESHQLVALQVQACRNWLMFLCQWLTVCWYLVPE